MLGLRIRSRVGNVVVAVVGALYAIAAMALLVYYVVSVWGAATVIDRALQLFLLITVAAGVAFVSIGRDNLRGHRA